MKLGIVGSEAAKFDSRTEQLARELIRSMLDGDVDKSVSLVVSGGCHLGGIDIWAVEEARARGINVLEHRPQQLSWEGGYKERNIKIAQDSEQVVCITIKTFPTNYVGMRFPYCYHCKTSEHIKSGGCWTVKYARKLGKFGEVIVIE